MQKVNFWIFFPEDCWNWLYNWKKTIPVILTTAAGGGAPCGGGKKAGFTCGAGAVGWPGGGTDMGGCCGGIPVNFKIIYFTWIT